MREFNRRLRTTLIIGILLAGIYAVFQGKSNSFQRRLCSRTNDFRTMDINLMNRSSLLKYLYWTNSTSCRIVHDFGGKVNNYFAGSNSTRSVIDGQKSVCMDLGLAPKPGNCHVYSFGINFEWSFDEAFDRFGCQVYAFDPSMEDVEDHDHSPNIHFYRLGIGPDNTDDDPITGWKLRNLKMIYDTLRERHGDVAIDYLKIDVEQAEWASIPQMIRSGMLDRVKQFGLEIHFYDNVALEDYFRMNLKIIKSLEEHGMVRFASRLNAFSEGGVMGRPNFLAYELAWYNSRFLVPEFN